MSVKHSAGKGLTIKIIEIIIPTEQYTLIEQSTCNICSYYIYNLIVAQVLLMIINIIMTGFAKPSQIAQELKSNLIPHINDTLMHYRQTSL